MSDMEVRSADIMVNKTVKLPPWLTDWLRMEAAVRQTTVSHEHRRWLMLAHKYRTAISEAEQAPVHFLRSRPR